MSSKDLDKNKQNDENINQNTSIKEEAGEIKMLTPPKKRRPKSQNAPPSDADKKPRKTSKQLKKFKKRLKKKQRPKK